MVQDAAHPAGSTPTDAVSGAAAPPTSGIPDRPTTDRTTAEPPARAGTGSGSGTTPPTPPPPTPPDRGPFYALQGRDFRFLFLGTLTSGFGQWAQMIGMGLLVYELTDESAVQLAAVIAVGGFARLFSGPFIGVALDRYHRRSVMMSSTFASAAQGILLGVLVIAGWAPVWVLYIFSATEGVLSTTNQNVRQTFVHDVTTDDSLPNAVALNSIAQNLARIAGPPLAGVMAGFISLSAPFIFIGFMMGAALIFTMMISKETRQTTRVAGNPLTALKEGLAYILSDPAMLGLTLVAVVPALFVYPYIPLLPVFADEVLDKGSVGYGMLAASIGVGSFIGLMVLMFFGGRIVRRGRLLLLLMFAYISTLLFFTQSTSFPLALGLLTLAGMFHGVAIALSQTLVQLLAKDEMRGRATSVFQMGFALMPIGAVPMGLAVDQWGPAAGFGSFMAVSWAFALFQLIAWRSLHRA